MSPAAPTVQADSLPLSYGGRGEAGKEPFIPYKKANAILFFHNLFGGESFFLIIIMMTACIYIVFDSF